MTGIQQALSACLLVFFLAQKARSNFGNTRTFPFPKTPRKSINGNEGGDIIPPGNNREPFKVPDCSVFVLEDNCVFLRLAKLHDQKGKINDLEEIWKFCHCGKYSTIHYMKKVHCHLMTYNNPTYIFLQINLKILAKKKLTNIFYALLLLLSMPLCK